MSFVEINALLDTIQSDDEDIKNLMNDSDIEFIDESLIENSGSKSDLSLSTSCLDIENHLSDPNAPKPNEAVVRISQPSSDSDDGVPLSSWQVTKADKEWKRRKQFERAYVEKYVFAEDDIVNIDVQDPSPMQVLAKTVGLEGLLLLLKTESERYAEQNGRMFQTTLEELCAFLGINILMGIHKLPKMRDYWSADEGLGNTLIQKTTTRDRFLEILQNLHFADKLKKLPPKESESFDRAWKLRPFFFDHLLKHFQEALLPESHRYRRKHL